MTEPKRYEFDAVIVGARGGGALVEFPHDAKAEFGTGGQVKVNATFDGHPYRGSLAPMGGGRHVLGIAKAIRAAIGKEVGDRVRVVVVKDEEPRTVEVPQDLAKALAKNGAARAAWDKLSYTHRKEYVGAIVEAKKPETRARRVGETVETLAGKA